MAKRVKLHIDATSIDGSRVQELQAALHDNVIPLVELRPRPFEIVVYVRYHSLVASTRAVLQDYKCMRVEQRQFPDVKQFHLLCAEKNTIHIASRYDVRWSQDSFSFFCDNATSVEVDKCIVVQNPVIYLPRHFWPAFPVAGALMSNLYVYVWNLIVWRIFLGLPMALLSYLVDKPSTFQSVGINAVTVKALTTGDSTFLSVPNQVKWITLPELVAPIWIPATGDSIHSWSALRSQSRIFSVIGSTLVLASWIPPLVLENLGVTFISPNRLFNKMVNMYRETMTFAMFVFLLIVFLVFFAHLTVLLQRIRLLDAKGRKVSVWPLALLAAFPLFAHIASFAAHCRKHLGAIPTAAYAMFLFYVFTVFVLRVSVSWFTVPVVLCLPGFVFTASYAMNQWYTISTF